MYAWSSISCSLSTIYVFQVWTFNCLLTLIHYIFWLCYHYFVRKNFLFGFHTSKCVKSFIPQGPGSLDSNIIPKIGDANIDLSFCFWFVAYGF
jgi:hypothetical protein